MKRIDDLEQQIRELPVKIDPAMDERILDRAAAAMPAAAGASAGKPSTTRTGILIMKRNWTRFAAAAAIVIAAGAAYNALQPENRRAGAAFADVLRSVAKVRTVTYKQIVRLGDGREFVTEKMLMEPGHIRFAVPENHSITIQDRNQGITLGLWPEKKKAEIIRTVNMPDEDRQRNYLEWMRRLHEDEGRFVRQETLDGRIVNVFVVEKPFEKTTIWTDPASNLPVRTETYVWPNPKAPANLPGMAIHHGYFGGEQGTISGIRSGGGQGIQEETTHIRHEFAWDAELDASLFSVTPPAGYTVEESQYDDTEACENHLVEALRFWADNSGGAFPMTVRQMLRAEPKMVRCFGKTPGAVGQACRMARNICEGVFFADNLKVQDNFHYAGSGVKLGQGDKPICWWMLEDGRTCRVIYDDLAVRDVPAGQLAGVAESADVEPPARTVRYKQTIVVSGEKKSAGTSTILAMEPAYRRTEQPGGEIMITDFTTGMGLTLQPELKRAYQSDYHNRRAAQSQPASASQPRRHGGFGSYNPVEEMAVMHLRGNLRGPEQLDGRSVDVYEYEAPDEKGTVWLDPATELPVRIEVVNWRLADLLKRIGRKPAATDGGEPAKDEWKRILTDFEWDVPLDASLFSTDVPEGYSVQKR